MSTQITIHGKRVETIYAFTVEYKGEKITGRYILVDDEDEDEPLGLPEEHRIWDWDTYQRIPYSLCKGGNPWNPNDELQDKIKQAIKDYDKVHR